MFYCHLDVVKCFENYFESQEKVLYIFYKQYKNKTCSKKPFPKNMMCLYILHLKPVFFKVKKQKWSIPKRFHCSVLGCEITSILFPQKSDSSFCNTKLTQDNTCNHKCYCPEILFYSSASFNGINYRMWILKMGLDIFKHEAKETIFIRFFPISWHAAE